MKNISQAGTGNDPGRAGFSPDLRVVRRVSIDPTKVEYRERRNVPVPQATEGNWQSQSQAFGEDARLNSLRVCVGQMLRFANASLRKRWKRSVQDSLMVHF